MKNTIIITVLVLILGSAGGFFVGMKYQQSKVPSGRLGNFRQGQGGQFQPRQGGRPVNGEIISADDKSITVKMQDGSSKIILVSDQTSINKAGEGTKDDLKVGAKAAVFGQENSDGTLTAQNIQLNPRP